MRGRLFAIVLLILQLASCASVPDKIGSGFELYAQEALYKKTEWSFLGRIVITDQNNALSANISWEHFDNRDEIDLSGVFGIGRTKISLSRGRVEIKSAGESDVQLGDIDGIVSSMLGVKVPISSLKYWVLGLVDPYADFIPQDSGFDQHGWKVRYLQMQLSGKINLPRKIRLEQGSAKLKLIVNQWDM